MRRSLRSTEGELLIDHRASPGLSSAFIEQARAHGIVIQPVAAGETYESPTIVCCHCGVEVVLNPQRTRPRGYCAKCDHYVCDHPICNRECKPLAQAIDLVRNHIARTGVLPPAETLKHLLPATFTGEE